MLRIKTVHALTFSLASMFLLQSCGGKKDNGRNGGGGPMGGGGQQALTDVKADFSGAIGVLVIDPNQTTSSLRLIGGEDGPVNLSLAETGSSNGDGSLAKVGSDGEVSSAISSGGEEEEKDNNGWCCKPKLPAVKTIAISPNKEIYLHFERSFVYKAPDDGDWSDAWEPSSGNMCQIFKVKGGTIEDLIANPPLMLETSNVWITSTSSTAGRPSGTRCSSSTVNPTFIILVPCPTETGKWSCIRELRMAKLLR